MLTKYKWSLERWHQAVELGLFAGERVEFKDEDIIQLSPEGSLHSYKNETIRDRLLKLLAGQAYARQAHPIDKFSANLLACELSGLWVLV